MKISIVIPVYNEADRLGACLQAIAAQTIMPYEVVVVDNNSTDGSRAVAERFEFVRVVSEQRQGIVHARDRGFDAARGDIIARIDADSQLPADWVEHIVGFYNQPGSDHYAFSGGAHFYNVRWARAVSWLYNLLVFDFNHLLIGHATVWGSNMALTQQQWQAVRRQICHRRGTHEDLDLAIHLRQAGFGIFYDRNFQISAQMRRVRSNRQELWDYLQWWPNTLRLHGKKSWLVCWLCACLLYALTFWLNASEYLARWLGWTPLTELPSEALSPESI